jgi:chromosome partitioning protein
VKKIAVWCQKGGTGKSTIAAHLAYASSAAKRIILIDADPQASLTNWLLKGAPRHELADVLTEKATAKDAIENLSDNLDLLPLFSVGGDLGAFASSGRLNDSPFIFDDLCRDLESLGYDIAVFDMSPGFRTLEQRILIAVDEVITPITPEAFGLDALQTLKESLRGLNASWRRNVAHRFLIVNRMNKSFRRHRIYRRQLLKQEYDLFTIPQDAKIGEGQMVNETVFTYDPGSKAIPELRRLAAAVLEGQHGNT